MTRLANHTIALFEAALGLRPEPPALEFPASAQNLDTVVVDERVVEKRPAVSVVTNTRDQWSYLPATIDSLLSQNIKQPYEIIIVDDGSTDGTFEKLKARYAKHIENGTIRSFRISEPKGIGAARNLGIKNARGEYICLDQPGDIVSGEKLAVLRKHYQNDPQLGLVFSDTIEKKARSIEAIAFSSVMFPKRVAEQVGLFDPHLQEGDYDFWLRISERYGDLHDNSILGRYASHTSNPEQVKVCSTLAQNKAKVRKMFGHEPKIYIMFFGTNGGIGRAAIEQAEALFREGVTNITLINKDGWGNTSYQVRELDSGILSNPHQGQCSPYYQDSKNWKRFSRWEDVVQAYGRPEIAHVHHANFTNELRGLKDASIVYTLHMIAADRQANDGIDRGSIVNLQGETLQMAGRVVALTDGQARIMSSLYPQYSPKLSVIPNGARL